MRKKQFKTESQKLLDMMINSIYTNREIFLRELISNASDALDKLYFRSLTDSTVSLSRGDYAITLDTDKAARTLTVSDNGCGMTDGELEENLGTIARSGSFDFKRSNDKNEEIDVIGQFGVGFYSAFMVAKKIVVRSRPYGSDTAYSWESEGASGYTVSECEKAGFGTEIVLYLKDDTDDEKYSEYLEEYTLRRLVKKYSDYIRYPIKMEITETDGDGKSETRLDVLNSMIPLWKKSQSEVSDEEYTAFYTEKFFDYEAPIKVITQKSEGMASYNALMFIPSHIPFNYYTKDYEKGLALYSSGVMITERCAELLPDYFGFVKGLVDSQDLSLNISREMLQQDRQLKTIAKAIEKKIRSELEKMLTGEREKYEKLFDAFGLQLKYGMYSDYGMHKDTLKDLVLFHSSEKDGYVSFKEYTERMKEGQTAIYYAAGETRDKIAMLPQVEAAISHGYEVLYLTDDVDEFAIKTLGKYGDFEFKSVTADAIDFESDEDRALIKEENEKHREMLDFIKEKIGTSSVKFSLGLSKHPVCLSSEGELSVEMEKVLKRMPGAEGAPAASIVLEINNSHRIKDRLIELYRADRERLASYAKILFATASLISGLSVENPTELSELICDLM